MAKRGTPIERFWRFVSKAEPPACWLWLGAHNQKGYGLFRTGGAGSHRMGAHRFVYLTLIGLIPDGLVLDHICNNPGCVNPSHLRPVTNGFNLERAGTYNWQRSKTHCPYGHPYDLLNTRIDNNAYNGSRVCRTCSKYSNRVKREASHR